MTKNKRQIKRFEDTTENFNISDVKSKFYKLSLEHKNYIKMAFKKSDEIYKKLEEYYTADKIKTFNSYEDFLEEINYILETDSIAKPNFVNMVQKNYF